MPKRPLPGPAVFAILLAAVLASRWTVMNRSVLDWDESLYFLMAEQWRAGHLPYTTIWDNKPVGIYAIFALFQALLGAHIFAIRTATVLFVSVLGFAVFQITALLTERRAAAWAAGAALVLGSLSNDGLSANTELFMAAFTVLGVWAMLATRSGFIVGLCLGAAFMVKYVAVFEAPIVFFAFLLRQRRFGALLAGKAGGALPLLAVVALYAYNGDLHVWLECSVLSNFRRVSAPFSPHAMDSALWAQGWRWGGFYALAGATLVWAVAKRRGTDLFLGLWLLGGLAGVVSAKSFYDHYFLQVLPVLCVMLGVWQARIPWHWAQAGFVALVLALPAWAAARAVHDAAGPDVTREMAADLSHAGAKSLYVFDGQPILYALTGLAPPTRFVLPSELTGLTLPQVAGVNPVAEVGRILGTEPEFVVRRTQPATENASVVAVLNAALAAHYRVWKIYPGVEVLRATK